MRSKPVFELPEVEADLEAAIAHYSSWRSDGRAHVLEKYDETIGSIELNPDLFPRKHGDVQCVILNKSYYIIYYLQEEHRTLVIAVLDGRRKPSAIRRMIKKRRLIGSP